MKNNKKSKKVKLKKHRKALVKYGDHSAEIDKKIAPLILAMWKCGFKTNFCCENEADDIAPNFKGKITLSNGFLDFRSPNQVAYVMMRKEKQVLKFINILDRPFSNEREREDYKWKKQNNAIEENTIAHQGFYFTNNNLSNKIIVKARPIFSLTENKMSIMYKIYIPHSSLKEVVKKLNNYIK